MLGGQVISGASRSCTFTVKEQEAVFPPASVTVQVTLVTPTGKKLPEGGTQTTVGLGQLSVTTGAKWTTAPHCPGSFAEKMSNGSLSGQEMVGGWVSRTVTVKEHVAVLP